MYKINDRYVAITFEELCKTQKYIKTIADNREIYYIQSDIDNYIKEEKESYKFKSDETIIKYVLQMYRDTLNLNMIKNSIMWSVINLDNLKKAELEFLYKTVVATKLREKLKTVEQEKDLILNKLEDNAELFNYIVYTQSMEDYVDDNLGKQKVLEHLKDY